MNRLVNYFSAPVFVGILIWTVSLSAQAGNVLIIKDINDKSTKSESSFDRTNHHASVTNFTWTQVFGVCNGDCVFSGFDGSIENLTIDGKLVRAGSVQVVNSKIDIDKLGEVIVYAGPNYIVLALTPEQAKILERP
jgi:hypothetical protein